MLDDLNKRSGTSAHRDGARPVAPVAGMTDREIPILSSAAPFDAMHRWLDGEGSEAAALHDVDSARYVALWRRVGQETARRRTQRLSSDFTSRVMNALPGGTPQRGDLALVGATATATPSLVAAPVTAAEVAPTATWWQGHLELNRGTALAAATGLVAVGLLLGAALRS